MVSPSTDSLLGTLFDRLARLGDRLAARWRFEPPEGERHEVRTGDGWLLPLFRFRRTVRPERGPVLLQHGLGASASTFLMPGRSLALYLSEQGFDVWVSSLRGRRGARAPGGVVRWDWDIDDYRDEDLPAIFEAILTESGADRIGWVGHSMGAVLLYQYAIANPDAPFTAGVACAGSLDYKVGSSGFQGLVRFLPLARRWIQRVPFGTFWSLYAPFVGLLDTPLDRFGHHPRNTEWSVARRYFATVYHDIPIGVMTSLATTFEPDGFQNRERTFSYTNHADRFEIPLLALAGDSDRQCDAVSVAATVDRLGSRDKEIRVFGPAHGHARPYGHFDLIVGRSAPQETWPAMARWLAERV